MSTTTLTFDARVHRRRRYVKKIPSGYYPHYFGRWKPVGRKWTWRKLYTDKALSQKEWRRFQKEQEQLAAGFIDEKVDRIRRYTLADLLEQYLQYQRSQRRSDKHIEITSSMLRRLLEAMGWRTYRDVRVADIDEFFRLEEHASWTVEYRIAWIKKIKAFINWLRPKGYIDPLEELKRPSRRHARQTKGRRVGSSDEVRALLSEQLPLQRRLAYALGVLNGLRRGEAAGLIWRRVLLDGEVPLLRIPPKDSDAAREFDQVPIHPLVEQLLREVKATEMSSDRVLPAVPDNKTIKRDLERAGFTYKNEEGRLLCYHALRHTFKHDLEKAQTPYTPVRQLMRHIPRSVTDAYGPSELREMYQYLQRLHPDLWKMQATADLVVDKELEAGREQLHHLIERLLAQADIDLNTVLQIALSAALPSTPRGDETTAEQEPEIDRSVSRNVRHAPVSGSPSASSAGVGVTAAESLRQLLQVAEEQGLGLPLSSVDLKGLNNRTNVASPRPDTQAD